MLSWIVLGHWFGVMWEVPYVALCFSINRSGIQLFVGLRNQGKLVTVYL